MKKNLQIIFYILMIISLILSLASRMLLMPVDAAVMSVASIGNISATNIGSYTLKLGGLYTLAAYNDQDSAEGFNPGGKEIYAIPPFTFDDRKSQSMPVKLDMTITSLPKLESQYLFTVPIVVSTAISLNSSNFQCGIPDSSWESCFNVSTDSTAVYSLYDTYYTRRSYQIYYVSYLLPNDYDNKFFDTVQVRINKSTSYNGSYIQLGVANQFTYQVISDNSTNQQLVEESKKQTEQLEQQTQTQKEIQDSINDDDVTGVSSSAGGFFGDFEEKNFGLQDVVTAPLVFIRNLLNHSCESLDLQLPFVNKIVHLPCMHAIYTKYFGVFFLLYQQITTGVISYAVLIRIFATVKGLQDPQNDKIQVMSL